MDSLPPPPPPPPPFPTPSPSPFPNAAPTPMPAPPKSSGGKWVLLGCGGCLGLIVLGVLFSVGIFLFTISTLKKSDVYTEAFRRAQDSAEVQKELGTPIATGWAFNGSVNYNNGIGNAAFTVPVSGPKGEGTLEVKADKSAGSGWNYTTLEVEFPSGKKVDLRGAP